MPWSKAKLAAYQRMFDEFVQEHRLDIEYDNWPVHLQLQWDDKMRAFYTAEF